MEQLQKFHKDFSNKVYILTFEESQMRAEEFYKGGKNMGYVFRSKDGLCRSNNVEFINNWNDFNDVYEENDRQWVVNLRKQGVKASHPDDG